MTSEAPARTFRFGDLWSTAIFSAAWILPWALLIAHLRTFWTLAPDYQYGWAVLPLGVYLLFRRWTGLSPETTGRTAATGLAAVCAALILPLWFIRAAVPDWSVISYALAFTVIGYTLAMVAWRAGWGTARAIAFPVCFILCAVPWPQRAENAIIQTLSRIIASSAAEVLQWMGIGAVPQGNVISLGKGAMEIADACSGIRSMQAMLVAALTLGEIFWLRIPRRLALVGAGWVIALVLNLLRNILLALITNASGLAALDRWHDPAGWAVLLLSLPLLSLLARHWRELHPPAAARAKVHLHPLPAWSAVALTIWFGAVAGGVELWYRAHECRAPAAHRLEVHWPADKVQFDETPLDDRTRDLLLCSDAKGAWWDEPDGTRWHLTLITWAPGRTSAQSARLHRPEVCFQATGAEFEGKLPLQPIAIPGGTLIFEPLRFRAGNQAIHVFFCLYEEANQDDPSDHFQSRWARVRRAFLGQRNLGQQAVELSVQGYANDEAALRALAGEAPALLGLRAPSGPRH